LLEDSPRSDGLDRVIEPGVAIGNQPRPNLASIGVQLEPAGINRASVSAAAMSFGPIQGHTL
jgi:hypothetical protein